MFSVFVLAIIVAVAVTLAAVIAYIMRGEPKPTPIEFYDQWAVVDMTRLLSPDKDKH